MPTPHRPGPCGADSRLARDPSRGRSGVPGRLRPRTARRGILSFVRRSGYLTTLSSPVAVDSWKTGTGGGTVDWRGGMIVLHALWSPETGLHVWGEYAALPAAPPRGRSRSAQIGPPRPHPFACPADELHAAV